MKSTLLAASAALVALVVPFSSPGHAALYDLEAAFDAARFADDLSGSYSGAPDAVIRVRVYASAGSWISATLSPEPATAAPIADVALKLLDENGVDQNVTGSAYDKTVAGSGTISWRKVPLASTGLYDFLLSGTSAGDWRLKLKGSLKQIVQSVPSPADLAVGAEATVDFEGLRGGTVSFNLAPTGTSKFRGELVRVERPDGTPIDGAPAAAKGKVLLDVDGLHRLVFKNVGPGLGPWIAKTTMGAPPIYARRGYVRPAGTALVPIVSKVTPASDYHLHETDVTLTGRDFQPGADVRLVRDGFEDIVATGVLVDSETKICCTIDLDTAPVTGDFSTGKWRVAVFNAPTYGTPGDPKTLDKASPTHDQKRTFNSAPAGSITLPQGAIADTETWQLAFNADFQTDLNNMALDSSDPQTAKLARNAVQAYVVCFLRDLMRANETTGKPTDGVSPRISFVVGKVPSAAGKPGRDYNRIEIGGAWQEGDPDDPSEPLPWGFAPLGQHPVDLSVEIVDACDGSTTRVGLGVRTDVLSLSNPSVNPDWAAALSTLNQFPLTIFDRGYFAAGYAPSTVAQANRYRDIVNHITRVAREIAAIIAHHIGRSMGLAPGGSGPMANPATSGYMWPTTTGLAFTEPDLALLRTNAKPVTLPGKSKTLTVTYFPLLATQPSLLPNSTANVDYNVAWNFVGGRANAVPADYQVRMLSGLPILSYLPIQGAVVVNFQGLTITNSPVYIDAAQGLPYGGIAYIRLTTTDIKRGGATVLFYRLNVLPNFAKLPTSGVVYQRALSLQQYIANN
jgi:hypothetical protein